MIKKNKKPIIIGTTALKTNINDGGLYKAIVESHIMAFSQIESNDTSLLPIQQSISCVQNIYLALTKETTISIAGVEISFLDDEWDKTKKYKVGKLASNYKFDFAHFKNKKIYLSDYMKTVLKLYTIFLIVEYGIDCSTNIGKVLDVKKMMLSMIEKKKNTIEDWNLDDLKEFYTKSDWTYQTMIGRRRLIQDFLVFYSFLTNHYIYTKEIDEWLKDTDYRRLDAERENCKTVCPPSKFYHVFTEFLYKKVNDNSLSIYERGIVGLLFIGTQTGLRATELAILTEDCIEVYRLDENGLKYLTDNELMNISFDSEDDSVNKYVGILHYRSMKSSRTRTKIYCKGETNASKKVIRVVQLLKGLFAEERKKRNTDALVPNGKVYKKKLNHIC